jgi:hypothetical protein
MRKGWLYLIVGGVAVLIIGVIVGLYLLGGDHQAPLERLRDISLVFISLAVVIVVMLLAGLVGVSVWLAFMIKDRVIPVLEELNATASRIRGTTEFVSEEVATPIISAYSRFAGMRAMMKTVVGTNRASRSSSKATAEDVVSQDSPSR